MIFNERQKEAEPIKVKPTMVGPIKVKPIKAGINHVFNERVRLQSEL